MKFLRRISTRQLLALCSAVVVLGVAATGLALATTGGGPKPNPRPLAVAVHDALAAPSVEGVSGRIQFTNHLVAGSSIQGTDPLLSGASGRFWASPDGRVRVELQADASGHGGTGDVQILADHSKVTVYDSGANTAYEVSLPPKSGSGAPENNGAGEPPPSVAQIQAHIDQVMRHASLSGAIPSDVAGQPAYTVRVSPQANWGMIGGAELAWDAVHGTPLRAALYAKGDSSPVLELKVTDISFGAVPDSVFDVSPPPGVNVTHVNPPQGSAGSSRDTAPVIGLNAVQQRTGFRLSAPDMLAGQARSEVRLISSGKDAGAVVTYGQGLGGIAVLELPANHESSSSAGPSNGSGAPEGNGQLQLPTVSINGAQGQELDTALGTVIRFQRNGVQYVVAGSVPAGTVQAAAHGL
jgi:outer membrane lipoprotein-sorting protein